VEAIKHFYGRTGENYEKTQDSRSPGQNSVTRHLPHTKHEGELLHATLGIVVIYDCRSRSLQHRQAWFRHKCFSSSSIQ
jgi:hypothetical protein